MCPGETFATAEVFLTLTTLLQRYTILLEEGSTFDIESSEILNQDLTKFNLRFVPRQLT